MSPTPFAERPAAHLIDDELQALAEGLRLSAQAEAHLAGCAGCEANAQRYRQLSAALAELPRPQPPLDFTATLLARLPAEPRRLSLDDLAASLVAVLAAGAAAVLFTRSDAANVIFQVLRHLPGRAIAAGLVQASLQGHDQVSVLLTLSAAALLLGAPLWSLLSSPRTVAELPRRTP